MDTFIFIYKYIDIIDIKALMALMVYFEEALLSKKAYSVV